MSHEIAEIVNQAEHGMNRALDAFKPAFDGTVLRFRRYKGGELHQGLGGSLDQNRRNAALAEIEEVKWKTTIELHNIRCVAESALLESVDTISDERGRDKVFFETTEILREMCRGFIAKLEVNVREYNAIVMHQEQ